MADHSDGNDGNGGEGISAMVGMEAMGHGRAWGERGNDDELTTVPMVLLEGSGVSRRERIYGRGPAAGGEDDGGGSSIQGLWLDSLNGKVRDVAADLVSFSERRGEVGTAWTAAACSSRARPWRGEKRGEGKWR